MTDRVVKVLSAFKSFIHHISFHVNLISVVLDYNMFQGNATICHPRGVVLHKTVKIHRIF